MRLSRCEPTHDLCRLLRVLLTVIVPLAATVVLLLLLATLAPAPAAAVTADPCTPPSVIFTYVPPFGSSDRLAGRALCADPATHRIAVFIYVNGWWTKPYWSQPLTTIAPDGSWNAAIMTGGIDELATEILACLLPAGVDPPNMGGQSQLPPDFLAQCLDIESVQRAPGYRTVDFAGYPWRVKASINRVGPGPNYFSDETANVWVDAAKALHLKISGGLSTWYAAEVINMASTGYGVYTFTLRSPVDQLDPNVVLGLFTWDDMAPSQNYREIDVEFSRWGDPAALNAQYVVQPYTTVGNRNRFSLTLPGERSRHIFAWHPDRIDFMTQVEDPGSPGVFQTANTWSYTGASTPPAGAENPRINLWLLNGAAPTDGQAVEVVVENFVFSPFTGTAALAAVARAGAGSGTVTADPPGIDCGFDCAEDYPLGTQLVLTATPLAGSEFAGWSGDCAGTATCSLVLGTGKSVTATFRYAAPPLNVAVEGHGRVTSDPLNIDCPHACTAIFTPGAAVTLTAAAMPSSVFSGWSGACTGAASTCTVTLDQARAITATFALTGTPLERALQHLDEVMDQYHGAVDVYTDLGAAGNHFAHRAAMGPNPAGVNEAYTGTVHSGATAIRVAQPGAGWGGWYFQNGILLADDVQPRANWGDTPNAGVDLTGATQLTFFARGETGGERVEFFAFGVGRDPATGSAEKPYPDAEVKVTTCGRLISPCSVQLDTTWRPYTITLSGLNLAYTLGGFGWVADSLWNNGRPISFLIDDIRIHKSLLDAPRFLVSYRTLPGDQPFDTVQRNVAFSYDNALALAAYVAAGDWRRAQLLADAFVYAQQHDRYYGDGRLRNAYQAGDLILPPGWTPNDRTATVRMPGWWDPPKEHWYEDRLQVSSYTGDMAWVMLALLNYYQARGGSTYLDAAEVIGEWIYSDTLATEGPGGYTGGYQGWERDTTRLTWKSTEHNLDLYVAFARLAMATGDAKWWTRSDHALRFVEALWNDTHGHYWTGTITDGVTLNQDVIPLDAQSWALLALGPSAQTKRAIDYAGANHRVTDYGFTGFDFDTDRDQPWFEGTGQMAVAYDLLGRATDYTTYRDELRSAQVNATNADDRGIVAAPQDGLTTGFEWRYFNRLHIGATAWFIFAEQGYNPFWATSNPPPQIESIAPPSGTHGAVVTIQGANFVDVRAVRFHGLAAAYEVLSSSLISATVPAAVSAKATATPGSVAVATLAGIAYSEQPFTITNGICYRLTRTHTGSGADPVATPGSSAGCPPDLYAVNATISLTATPESGWQVAGWSGTDHDASTASSNRLTMPAAGHTVAVSYTAVSPLSYLLTVVKAGDGSGTVGSQPQGIDCGSDCTERYPPGTEVTLTVTATYGSVFTGWAGACSGSSECKVTMDADKAVTTTLEVARYNLFLPLIAP